MRHSLLVFALAATAAFFMAACLPSSGGSSVSSAEEAAAPDPVTCAGYPEKRVYLENQSWVTPQPGPSGHPGTGKQGHIHIGTCFPLFQTLTASTLALDMKIQLHHFPGQVTNINVQGYPFPKAQKITFTPAWTCPDADCERWVHMDFNLDAVEKSGMIPFLLFVNGWLYPDGPGLNLQGHWYNVTRWQANVQNGAPCGVCGSPPLRVGGDTWLENVTAGAKKYSEARMDKVYFPWNSDTGLAIPKSGIWRPVVFFEGQKHGQALIDPQLHAVPPDLGWEVYKGPHGYVTLEIDTTRLTNGPHRLLLSSCHNHDTGRENCGIQVVPFTVANESSPPPPPPSGEVLLDDFNRANGGAGVNWTHIDTDRSTTLQIVSNQATGSGSGSYTDHFWNPSAFGPDVKAHVTVAALETNTAIEHRVYARLANAGTSAPDGYAVAWVGANGGAWRVYRIDNGGYTALTPNVSNAPIAPGDKIGIEVVGNTIKALHWSSAGGWVEVMSRTDATYAGAGNVGVGLRDTARFDDFTVGAL